MTPEQIIRRADILNTQILTRNNGKRLGVVTQLWVDIDQREVVALSLRSNPLAVGSVPRYMYLSSIRQVGDVILVDNEDVIEDIDVDAKSRLINSEVITETGELLGQVRDFQFNRETCKVDSLQIAALGRPQIPAQILSTYSLSIYELVSSGPDRLIVFAGAQERLEQLSVGLLERLGLGEPSWKRNKKESSEYSVQHPLDSWDEDEWGSEDDDLGGSPPMPSPRRPRPGPRPNETAEPLPIF